MEQKARKKKLNSRSLGTGVAAGFAASLCCVGPLVIILFGLGGVSAAMALTPQLRIAGLLLAFVFVISAVLLHLKKKNKTCDINCFSREGLRKEQNFIIATIVTMVVIYLVMVYAVVPVITPLVYSILG